jgi:hypothetical protein
MPPEGSDLIFDHRHNADERSWQMTVINVSGTRLMLVIVDSESCSSADIGGVDRR